MHVEAQKQCKNIKTHFGRSLLPVLSLKKTLLQSTAVKNRRNVNDISKSVQYYKSGDE